MGDNQETLGAGSASTKAPGQTRANWGQPMSSRQRRRPCRRIV